MPEPIVLMNFTDICRPDAYRSFGPVCVTDCRDIQGTRGYCSEEARKEIAARIGDFPPEGVRLLDSGNYHYLSALWTEKIKKAYALIVLDHHTDMQEPLFGPVLSCGSWVLDAALEQDGLKKVILYGAEPELAAAIDPRCADRLAIPESRPALTALLRDTAASGLPVYLSVDKDVLSPDSLDTDWDQGTMPASELLDIVAEICGSCRMIGVDICGEPAQDAPEREKVRSESINRSLIRIAAGCRKKKSRKTAGLL